MWLYAVLVWIFCGIAAAFVAQSRGASGSLWFWLGVLFGPFGLACAFAAGTDRRCPHCRQRIHPEATRCPKCQSGLVSPAGQDLDPTTEPGTAEVSSLPERTVKQCPYCAETILASARKCKHCGEFLDRATAGTFCTECGQPLTAGLKFCGECGKSVWDMPKRTLPE